MPNVRPEDPPQRSGTSRSSSETGPVWPLNAGDEAELLVGKSEIPGSRSVHSNGETPGSRTQALGKIDLMTEALSRWVSEGGTPLRVKGRPRARIVSLGTHQLTATSQPAPPGVLSWRARPGTLIRWWVRFRTAELDEALASGRDPVANRYLLWRAQRLTEPQERTKYADTIQRIVDDVVAGGPPRLPGLRLKIRVPIAENVPLLLRLVKRLKVDRPAALRGLAMVELLVGYGDSPLYRSQSPLQLRRELLAVLDALEPS